MNRQEFLDRRIARITVMDWLLAVVYVVGASLAAWVFGAAVAWFFDWHAMSVPASTVAVALGITLTQVRLTIPREDDTDE